MNDTLTEKSSQLSMCISETGMVEARAIELVKGVLEYLYNKADMALEAISNRVEPREYHFSSLCLYIRHKDEKFFVS